MPKPKTTKVTKTTKPTPAAPSTPPMLSKRKPWIKRIPRIPRTPRMIRSLNCLVGFFILFLATGCARFHTSQLDARYENGVLKEEIITYGDNGQPVSSIRRYENGVLTDKISTKAGSSTLWSAKSELTNFDARQTEKTQGAKVGTLIQQGGTNGVAALSELRRLFQAVNGLPLN